jgi:Protein of unknown function (DUF5131)
VSTATAIEWTETTWNPTTGCDRISPGCDHCYALTLAGRLKAMSQAKYQRDGDPRTSGPGFGVTMHPDALLEPLGWRKPRHVFVDSMADLPAGVGAEDGMIAGHRLNIAFELCATSVADRSRRTTGRPSPFDPTADRQHGQAEQHRPGNRSPTRSSSPGNVSCPDS